ncbi:MAG: sodium/proline symporter [Simkaniaceae bacterium]|nr:sodium/proline symporter [Candidatus Sacchlamyda saccharinae]
MNEFFAIFIYFAFLIFFANHKQKKALTQKDFVIGDRSLDRWTTALAAHASDMSNWLFMAYPGAVFISGGNHIWAAIGLTLMMWANWVFIAPKIRTHTEKMGSVTLSGFFEKRLGQNGAAGRIITSSTLFLFYTVYVAAALCGIGILFQTLFPISYALGVILGVVLILPFVLIGGYMTLARVDLFQGFFLLAVILFVPLYITFDTGGIHSIIEAIHSHGKKLSPFSFEKPSMIWSHLLLMFGWGLGYFGQPHIITKFMGIRNPKEISSSKKIGMSWQILTLLAATYVGFVGIATLGNLSTPEHVFILLVKQNFAPFLSGLFLCAILAAILNAVSSMLLILSTTISEDLYKRFFNPNPSDKTQIRVTRIACILSALVALSIALPGNATIDSLVKYAWSGLGATFGPLTIATLYFRHISSLSCWLGVAIGAFLVAISPFLNLSDHILVLAFPAALATIYLIARLTKAPITLAK